MAELNNPRHEKFAQELAKGKSQRIAYRIAFPSSVNWKDTTVDVKACGLAKNDKVVVRLKELAEISTNDAIMSAQERLIYLSKIINGEAKAKKIVSYRDGVEEVECEADVSDKLKAIDLMNKMQGEYVQKVQASMSYEDNLKKVADEDEY